MSRLAVLLARACGLSMALVGSAWALPSLQLGPGDTGTWEYVGGGDDTWYVSDSAFTFSAYANAVGESGGDAFVKDTGPASSRTNNVDRTAYLVFSAVPGTTSTTPFALSVSGDSGPLTLVQQGYGSPPDPDTAHSTDDLPSHGIYDTYFYIYEFAFDGTVGTIGNTQPGDSGTGQGYREDFSVLVSGLESGVTGVHMDLFTVVGDGKLKTTDSAGDPIPAGELGNQIFANAPFSHDGQYLVPEPGLLSLLAIGAIGFAWRHRAGRLRQLV